ncbi:MBL fold metallo-hydrolase [Desulfurobacterium sp.]|uniref:MBL fold metallo-hydrolase n=1 Tax=Desulfurobacterium sp. TaxID=2004706 RepID=UPI0026351B9B|nr:MBL fold metallo-hydrolase [Desulfurobacterium sp.]
MELKRLTEGVYYIPGRTNVGVIQCGGGDVILVDTGIDSGSGKRILRLLEKHGLKPVAIVNTHFHTDHCGGNRILREKADVKVYASGIAATVIKYPFINPFSLFSGVYPVKDLMNKFVMAQPSDVDVEIEPGELKIGDAMLEIVPLPGHAPGQVGIVVGDILFCGDAVFAPEVIERVGIPFNVDIKTEKETLKFLKNTRFSFYVPSHGEPVEDIGFYVSENFKQIDKIEKIILNFLEKEASSEEVVYYVLSKIGLKVKAAHHYFLIHAGILAYLSYLYNKDLISLKIDSRPLWKRK